MAVDLTDGALGIEARHAWINLATSSTLITLGNSQAWLDEADAVVPVAWPNYKITDITGLFDLPDIEDNSEPATEAVGLIPYPSRARAKNVTYTVQVRGKTLKSMRAAGAALRAAFGPDTTTGLNPTRLMVITPHPTYGTAEHAYTARCLTYAQGQDRQDRGPGASPTPYVRTVVIGLRMYDPRIFEWHPGEPETYPTGLGTPKW